MNRTLFGLALLSALILTPSRSEARTPVMCPEYYAPQCGAQEVQCIKAPCYPVYKTYSNSCFLNAEGAALIHEGECKANETGPYTGNTGGGSSGNAGTYVPPGNCSAWFDGCNSCSRSTVNGPAMCTLMACTSDTKPGYCKAYFGNVDPVVTPPDDTPIPVDIGGGIGDTPIPVEPDGGIGDMPEPEGFFTRIWISISSWFSHLF